MNQSSNQLEPPLEVLMDPRSENLLVRVETIVIELMSRVSLARALHQVERHMANTRYHGRQEDRSKQNGLPKTELS